MNKTTLQKETPRFKVSFYLEQDEDGYPPYQYEGVWVKKIGKRKYETDSIPFFVPNLSLGDIISIAEEDEVLYFEDVIKYSDNSVIQVILLDETQAENLKSFIVKNGCEFELFDEVNLVAIHIPGSSPIDAIQEYLSAGKAEGKWDYQESSLRHPA